MATDYESIHQFKKSLTHGTNRNLLYWLYSNKRIYLTTLSLFQLGFGGLCTGGGSR